MILPRPMPGKSKAAIIFGPACPIEVANWFSELVKGSVTDWAPACCNVASSRATALPIPVSSIICCLGLQIMKNGKKTILNASYDNEELKNKLKLDSVMFCQTGYNKQLPSYAD